MHHTARHVALLFILSNSSRRDRYTITIIMQASNDCPVCGKHYKTPGWRQNHLDNEHPNYSRPVDDASLAGIDSETEGMSGHYNASGNGFNLSGFSNHRAAPASFAKGPDVVPRDSPPRLPVKDGIFQHPNPGRPISYVPTHHESTVEYRIRNPHPYWPFEDQKTFNLARWCVTSGVPAWAIDELLKGDFPLEPSVKRSFASNYHLRKKLDMMDDGLGLQSWSKAVTNLTWNSNHPEPIEFYHRRPIEVAKWLLMQPYFEEYQNYNPIQRYINNERHYSDMFEADYMWDIQVSI